MVKIDIRRKGSNKIKPFIGRYYSVVLTENIISMDIQMHLAEIIVSMNLEYEGNRPNAKLVLTDNIKDIQLVKLFYDLKNRGYISNTSEQIAEFLTNAFDLNFNTVFSYLNEPKRFEKVQPLF